MVERGQLEDRVEQLCRALADRDGTIQRLEEDLLRIRMVSGDGKWVWVCRLGLSLVIELFLIRSKHFITA